MLISRNSSRKPITTYRRLLNREPLPFIGRNEIMLELREHFNRVFENEGRAVLIYGESGVGKTRLVEKFLDGISQFEFFTFRVKAHDTDNYFIEPFNTIIEQSLQHFDYNTRIITNFITMDNAPVIFKILPQLKVFYPMEIEPAAATELELFSAVYQVIENISRLKPTLIFIDDAHLLQPSARKLLEFIIERISDKPLFFILCFTDGMRGGFKSSHFSLNEKLNLFPVRLERLPLGETVRLVCSIFQEDLSSKFCRWIYDITRGNPFFIKELLKELCGSNVLSFSEEDKRWKIKRGYRNIKMPHSLKKIFARRIKKIDREEVSFLEVSSLLGEQFDPDLVRKVLRLSKKQMEGILAKLYERYLIPVIETNCVQFLHPIQQEVIRKDIPQKRRRILHRHIARILEKAVPYEFNLRARHATALLLKREINMKLCRLVFNAARMQENKGDLASACSYYKLALAMINRCKKEYSLGAVIIKAHFYILEQTLNDKFVDSDEASDITRRLIRFGLIRLAVDLYIAAYRSLYNQFRFREAEKYIKKIFVMLGSYNIPKKIVFRLKISHCFVLRRIGKVEKARTMIKRLLKEYTPEDNFVAFSYGLNTLGLIYYREGNYETALEHFNELITIAERFGHSGIRAVAQVNIASTFSKMGRFKEAYELFSYYQQMIYTSGREYKLPILWEAMAICTYFEGKYDDSRRYFDKAIECTGKEYHRFSCNIGKANTLIESGRLNEAYAILKEYSTTVPDVDGQEEWIVNLHILWAKYYLRLKEYKRMKGFITKALKLSAKYGLNIEFAMALILKGIMDHLVDGKKSSLSNVRKGTEILKKHKAFSCLGLMLCETGIFLQDVGIFKEGIAVLNKIKAVPKAVAYIRWSRNTGLSEKITLPSERERLVVRSFGGLKVSRSEKMDVLTSREWKSAKAREMFCLLLVGTETGGMTWEELALILWPEFGTREARNNFHFTLSTLREVLGAGYIIHQDKVYFVDREKIGFDLWTFEKRYQKYKQNLRYNKIHQAQKYADEALKISAGNFLPEFHNRIVETKRLQINSKIEELTIWLANRFCKKFEYFEAIRCCYRLLEKDPINETAHRIIIHSYVELGERVKAFRQYERLVSILKNSVGIEPSIETKKIIEKIRGLH
ncbi:MAG TPA: tetratricopeptide repeat protein [candidate division WOR-3 bacterium]|uniref:Tetratricopeptide repeat protein n=1 Tax=candidate division WOR-3 bacterium TaxID=2052148 RepID=A0A9C9ENT8_UNCW3|nr:tetratricopeptide repeat protein [candidate division WOR-3 bacterium]